MWRRPKDRGDDTYAADAVAATIQRTCEELMFIENGPRLPNSEVGKLRVAARTAMRVASDSL
jgi:hypothetical protein